jgi:adenylylsulfate kinase-like enzyme
LINRRGDLPVSLNRVGDINPVACRTQDGGVIWITGLSGAGKSSVASYVKRHFSDYGVRTILLDGDDLLWALGVTDAFDLTSRRQRAFVYARLALLLAGQGHVVICATIALFHAVQEWNRGHVNNYLEVFLDVPVEELRRRNPKGLYGPSGDERNMMGTGLTAEFPTSPDVVIRNFGDITEEFAAKQIVSAFRTGGHPSHE